MNASSNPSRDYAEAVRRIAALQALDTPEIHPEMGLCFLTQGRKVGRVIVLLHGYTNGPKQFHKLGELFYQRGNNVLIPRAPYHGMKDRLTTALAKLTGEKLLIYLNEVLDIAQGLGEQVIVAGLSMGGVLTAWAAQQRADVALAAPISPALAFQAIPFQLTPLVARLGLALPNAFRWWDPNLKDTPAPPLHAYPRYATRGVAQILRLSLSLQKQARHSPPKAHALIMITNPTDEVVDNRGAQELVASWWAAGAQNVETYAFDAKYQLIHDLINPDQPKQQVDIVYPILLDLLDRKA